MHLRCPHCHHPIDLVADDAFSDVTCPACGSHVSLIAGDTTASFSPGGTKRLAHFELLDQVGFGQFGTVWKARDTTLQRTVALKIPRRGQLSPDEIEYFFRDARAAAQLKHPNIVSVHEVGRDADTVFIASDFIDGANLKEWLSARSLTIREAAELMIRIAEAVQHAHDRGVIHRDLKPGNILMDQDGNPHVTDFGLAKRESGEITMTMDGQILGTPAYMSPEQARGKAHDADGRSDVYSLGVILFELLTGELPFRGEKRMLILQILQDEPPSPRKLNGRVPRDLETICLQAMSKEPAKRYATSQECADELVRFVAGRPIKSRPLSRTARSWRWCQRNPVVSALSAGVLLLLTTVSIVTPIVAIQQSILRGRAETLVNDLDKSLKKQQEATQKIKQLAQDSRLQMAQGYTQQASFRYEQGQILESLLFNAAALTALEDSESDDTGALVEHRTSARQLAKSVRAHLGADYLGVKSPLAAFRFNLDAASPCFSPDGSKLLESSEDGEVRLWDAIAGKPLGKPLRDDGRLIAICVNADGTKVATTKPDATLQLWDITSGNRIGSPLKHSSNVQAICFCRDDLQLALLDEEGNLCHWDVQATKVVSKQLAGADIITLARFNSDGTKLAIAAPFTNGFQLWDVSTGKLIGKGAEDDWVSAITFSPDGNRIATGSGNYIAQLWDSSTLKSIGSALKHDQIVFDLCFSPDSSQLATASLDGTARLWESESGRPVHEPLKHPSAVLSVAYSFDGKTLATASRDGTARLWNADTGSPLNYTVKHSTEINSACVNRNGRRLLTTTSDGTGRLWSVSPVVQRGASLTHEQVRSICISNDGSKLVSSSNNNTVRVWDLHSGQFREIPSSSPNAWLSPHDSQLATVIEGGVVQRWDLSGAAIGKPLVQEAPITAVSFNRSRTTIATLADKCVQLWDAITGDKLEKRLDHPAPVMEMCISPDGKTVATLVQGNTLHVWNLADDQLIDSVIRLEDAEFHPQFSPDGAKLMTQSVDSVQVWDVSAKKLLFRTQRGGALVPFDFSADGSKLAISTSPNVIQLWDVESGKPIGEPMQHLDSITSVRFSPSVSCLATSSIDGTTQTWDVYSCKRLGEPFQGQGRAQSVCFTPDGNALAVASENLVRIWDLSPPMAAKADQITQWAQCMAAAALDERGAIQPLTGSAFSANVELMWTNGGPALSRPDSTEHSDGAR